MPDIANFIAQNFRPQDEVQNMLGFAQDLKDAKQRNAFVAQDMMMRRDAANQQNALSGALQSGDIGAIRGQDPYAAQAFQESEMLEKQGHAQTLGTALKQISGSQNSRVLAGLMIGNPQVQEAAKSLGIPLDQVGDLSQYGDDEFNQTLSGLIQYTDQIQGIGGQSDTLQSVIPTSQGYVQQYKSGRQVETGYGLPETYRPVEYAGGKGLLASKSGDIKTLSTAEQESEAAASAAQARTEATSGVVPAKDRATAAAKAPRVQAASRRLERVSEAVEGIADNAILKGGTGQSLLIGLTEEGRELEQSKAQLLAEVGALTRIPGVGAQSDYEQRLQEMTLPDARFQPEVNRAAIKELRLFLDDLQSAYDALSAGKVPGFDTKGQPIGENGERNDDPLGIR